MDFIQIYETTITSPDNGLSATVLVIPARSFPQKLFDGPQPFFEIAEGFLNFKVDHISPYPYIDPVEFARIFQVDGQPVNSEEAIVFATYIANARIVPFESSPLGAESLASIAA